MLDVRKMSNSEEKNGRRIMTAMQKKQDFLLSAENSKPQTAIRKGRGQYLKSAVMCKAKSISKPTVNSLSRVISKPLIRD